MSKKTIFIIISVVILATGLWYWSKLNRDETGSQKIDRNAQLILFYGAECPHCKDLEKFIAENGIKDKVQFEELEVFHDKTAGAFFLEKAKECGLDKEESLGVPFFYARGQCLTGTPDIEAFLKKEAGI